MKKHLLLTITAAWAITTQPLLHAAPMQDKMAPAMGAMEKSQDKLAVKGYDVVAYFTDAKPEEGKPEYAANHDGKMYRFSSAAHKEMFVSDPEKYLPQYDGYCAFGASKGHKAAVDPKSWAIVDGKLYLNSSAGAQKAFDKDRAAAIKEADQNWKTLKDSK